GEGLVEVAATCADTRLGGGDYDQALMNHIADDFQKQHGIELRKDRLALQRLKEAAERAKIELSSSLKTLINLPFVAQVRGQAVHLQMELTRARFEELTRHLTERTREPVEQALRDAKRSPRDIAQGLLAGGARRPPAV